MSSASEVSGFSGVFELLIRRWNSLILTRHPLPQPFQFSLPVRLPLLCGWITAAFGQFAFFLGVDTEEFGEAWQAAVFWDWQASQEEFPTEMAGVRGVVSA